MHARRQEGVQEAQIFPGNRVDLEGIEYALSVAALLTRKRRTGDELWPATL